MIPKPPPIVSVPRETEFESFGSVKLRPYRAKPKLILFAGQP